MQVKEFVMAEILVEYGRESKMGDVVDALYSRAKTTYDEIAARRIGESACYVYGVDLRFGYGSGVLTLAKVEDRGWCRGQTLERTGDRSWRDLEPAVVMGLGQIRRPKSTTSLPYYVFASRDGRGDHDYQIGYSTVSPDLAVVQLYSFNTPKVPVIHEPPKSLDQYTGDVYDIHTSVKSIRGEKRDRLEYVHQKLVDRIGIVRLIGAGGITAAEALVLDTLGKSPTDLDTLWN